MECLQYEGYEHLHKTYQIPSLTDFDISFSYQTLVKRGYIVADPNKTSKDILSVKGKTFLKNLKLKSGKEKVEISESTIIKPEYSPDEAFEEWWKTYPTKTGWESEDKSVSFSGSRVLKNLIKANAKKRYLDILNQGIPHEDLLGSLKYEIKIKKVDSLKKNINQLEFFKGMESYFNQERYLMFIDLYKENPRFIDDNKISSKKLNVTDI